MTSRKPKPRTCRAVEANVGVRGKYRKRLLKLQDDFQGFVLMQLLEALDNSQMLAEDSILKPSTPEEKRKARELRRKLLKELAKGRPESLKDFIDGFISANLAGWLSKVTKAALNTVKNFVKSVTMSTSQAQRKALLSANFNGNLIKQTWTVPIVHGQYISPQAAQALPEMVRRNVSLISKICTDDVDRISQTLIKGLTEGQNYDKLREELRNTNGFNEARVNRVVIDQTNKINSQIQIENAKSLGITKAVWKHVPGQYTSRDTHIAMNGRTFELDKGLYDEDVGHFVLPGELPFCRCVSRMQFNPEQFND